jgi:hypothetical protein
MENLLDLSRLEAGRKGYQMEEIESSAWLCETAAATRAADILRGSGGALLLLGGAADPEPDALRECAAVCLHADVAIIAGVFGGLHGVHTNGALSPAPNGFGPRKSASRLERPSFSRSAARWAFIGSNRRTPPPALFGISQLLEARDSVGKVIPS